MAMSKVNDQKIIRSKEIGDFDDYFDGNDPGSIEAMQQTTEGGFVIAFEAVGSGEALNTCIEGGAPGGPGRYDRKFHGRKGAFFSESGCAAGNPPDRKRVLYPERI